jgi:hypothetical protein
MAKAKHPVERGTASDEILASRRSETSEKDLTKGERRRSGVRVEED